MIKPIQDFVIILTEEVKEDNSGGILLPEEMKQKPKQGKVVAIGKGIQAPDTGVWIEMQVAVGDTVIFARFGGGTIHVDGKEHLMMKQTDILAIL